MCDIKICIIDLAPHLQQNVSTQQIILVMLYAALDVSADFYLTNIFSSEVYVWRSASCPSSVGGAIRAPETGKWTPP